MKLPHTLSGIVVKNKGRGKTLGYPTANLDVSTDLEDGVYIGLATYNNSEYKALHFIGTAVTFGDTEKMVEAYILDFDNDIYGDSLTITFLSKLRDNKKFNSVEELITQIKKDVEDGRKYFAT